MKEAYDVDILVATYNGERYLVKQLDSLISQVTEFRFRIIISDDFSTDSTVLIIKSYLEKYDHIVFYPAKENLGVIGRFNFLSEKSSAKYIMFCDQDDVWHQNKIQKQIECLMEIENIHGCKTPILVHSDLSVVDKDLNTINNSFIKLKKLYPVPKVKNLIIENSFTGCAMAVNSQLLKIALPFPKQIIMHDWWLGLIGTVGGKIHFIDVPLIEYRQHERNVIGSGSKLNFQKILKKLKYLIFNREVNLRIMATSQQANALIERINTEKITMDYADVKILSEYARNTNSSLRTRLYIIYFGIKPKSLLKTLSLYTRMWYYEG